MVALAVVAVVVTVVVTVVMDLAVVAVVAGVQHRIRNELAGGTSMFGGLKCSRGRPSSLHAPGCSLHSKCRVGPAAFFS